jgi:hypothetical protein
LRSRGYARKTTKTMTHGTMKSTAAGDLRQSARAGRALASLGVVLMGRSSCTGRFPPGRADGNRSGAT